jgi:type I restriction enzyme S subunit
MAWSTMPLGKILLRSKERIEIQPDKEYREITVKYWGRGVTLRRHVLGAEIAAEKRYVAHANQFIVSRIDARHGAFGLVPESLDGSIVSGDFPVYDIDHSLMFPPFLDWMSKTDDFVSLSSRASEGTTRRVRLREDKFLESQIVVPPLEEQRSLVRRTEELKARITEARSFMVRTVEHADLLVDSTLNMFLGSSHNWRQLTVKECCEHIIDYRGRTPPLSDHGIPHITSANIKDGKIDWNTSKFVSEETYGKYMTRGIPRSGDVIFTMEAPLGETAVVLDQRRFSLAQRTLLLRGAREVVNGKFLSIVLTSPTVREAINAKATRTTVSGIALKRLVGIKLPIPPLDEQSRIVMHVEKLRTRTRMLKELGDRMLINLENLLPSLLDRMFTVSISPSVL